MALCGVYGRHAVEVVHQNLSEGLQDQLLERAPPSPNPGGDIQRSERL